MINTHNKIKVVHFERKSSYKAFSIERLFSDLRFESDHITKDIKIKKRNNIFPSRGFLFRLLDSLFASFYQQDINHITGDVHYLTYFLSKKKTILTIHDCGILENSKGFKFIFRWFFWFWLPNQCCEVITVISEPVKTNLLKFIKCKPSKIKVINNMVSSEFKPYLKIFNDTFPRILHIGLKENKNLLNHAKALKEINCLLVIIGKPSEKDIFILKENNIKYEIHFDLSRKEVLEEYKKCDLLLFASTYEGFGLPILEAQAVGRPVLTSNISPINKIVGEGAYLVDPFDPFSIKEGILKIINDKKLRTFLINSGYENVQKYSAQKISRQYFSIYKSLYLKNKKIK